MAVNCSSVEKLTAVEQFLKQWGSRAHAYTHLLVSTSTYVLFGASPWQLIERLNEWQVIIARSSTVTAVESSGDISTQPFFAYGSRTHIQNFIEYTISTLEATATEKITLDEKLHHSLQSAYAMKHKSWKLHIDASRAILAHTTTTTALQNRGKSYRRNIRGRSGAASSAHPAVDISNSLWVAKSEELEQEQGGAGLGRGYSLVRRDVSRGASAGCKTSSSQPDALLFSPSLFTENVGESDKKGYNFLVSKYLSNAPVQMKFCTKYNRKAIRLVASLTTLPHRLANIDVTLESLVSQHVKPNVIYLNIPKQYSRFHISVDSTLVARLMDKFNNRYGIPLVVNRLDKDLGPISKLLPTLRQENDPETIIITVDDDMIFKPTLFGILLQSHLNNPSIAFGVSGQMIDMDIDGSVHVRTAWKWKDGAYPVDILEGFTGAIYRRDFFDVDILADIPHPCVSTDDIWISAHLAHRGFPRVKLAIGWVRQDLFRYIIGYHCLML